MMMMMIANIYWLQTTYQQWTDYKFKHFILFIFNKSLLS